LLNKKALTPSERKYHIVSATLLVFVDAGENLVMVDDVATPSNPLVSLVEKEELEEAPLDMNVFQRRTKKNRPEEWCTLELIVQHGIVDCLLTRMP
jgi:hypothetical protein